MVICVKYDWLNLSYLCEALFSWCRINLSQTSVIRVKLKQITLGSLVSTGNVSNDQIFPVWVSMRINLRLDILQEQATVDALKQSCSIMYATS